jgi:hypothetical protein
MAGRGPQTFQKRLKEQKRKEKQQEKMEKRLLRKQNKGTLEDVPMDEVAQEPDELSIEPETAHPVVL